MFEITFLGTSASIPSRERNLSSIAVKREGDLLLFDCAEGTQRQMMKFGLSIMKIKAIFISHLHLDHVLGLPGLLETMKLSGRTPEQKLLIFGPNGTESFMREFPFVQFMQLRDGFEYKFQDFTFKAMQNPHATESYAFLLQENARRKFNEAKAKGLGLRGPMFTQIQKLGELEISGKKVKLSQVSREVKGKKICYSGDCPYFEPLAQFASKADLLVHESTFDEKMEAEARERKHSTCTDAARMAAAAKARKLVLTHISSRYADAKLLAEQARAIFPKVKIAKDGMKIKI
jgi:ribonuclease Z